MQHEQAIYQSAPRISRVLIWTVVALSLGGCRVLESATDSRSEITRVASAPRVGSASSPPGGASGGGRFSSDRVLAKTERRHVIIMIGDGMQLAHEVATSRYLYGTDRGLTFHGFPEQSYAATWNVTSYDARASILGVPSYSPESYEPRVGYDPAIGGEAPYPVTDDNQQKRDYFLSGIYPDSASTATAMATGIKTDSSAIAWRPNAGAEGAIETSPELLRRLHGMAIGFVTTVPFSHATPAGFFAHSPSRFEYTRIAHGMLTIAQPEVMIGGGWKNNTYYEAADLEKLVASNRYELTHVESGVNGDDGVLAAAVRANQQGKRLLALYGGGQEGSFPSPVPSDSPGEPHIARGSTECPTLANASVAALEVLSRDPEGFFLLIEQGDLDWANHANDFARMVGCVADLDEAVAAVVAFVERPADDIDWSNTTLLVTADHANSYLRLVRPLSRGDLPTQDGATYPEGEVTYGTGSHTAELVTVYAKGYAAAKLHDYEDVYPGLGIIDNTSIFRLTMDAAAQ